MKALTFTAACLAETVGGRLVGGDVEFGSISTDTRSLQPEALFVALRGPNFDAHDFVAAAATQGADVALVEHELPVPLPQVVVPDALAALSQYAQAWRRQFAIPVIGVTGSNGKTTTKELLGSILSLRHRCLVTQGNLNNHIGVPLTLLKLTAAHEAAVIEMGASHQQEIAHLAALAEPDIGIVTNAGAAHLEGFGGLDGVAKGKGELFEALSATGTAIVNADDAYADYWRRLCKCRVLTFAIDRPADFTVRQVAMQEGEQDFITTFELLTPDGACAVSLHLGGQHNLRNAVGAAAAAFAAGATLADIQAGLNAMRPVGGRLQPKAALNGAFIIDDSYNANPNSVRAGIDALRQLTGHRWLIFGQMLELGPDAPQLHAQVGEYARAHGIERMFAVGELAQHTVRSFGDGAQWFTSLDELIAVVRAELTAGTTVLIKGSRGNRLERAAAALAELPIAPSPQASSGH